MDEQQNVPQIDYADQYQPVRSDILSGRDVNSLDLKLRTDDILIELENILLNRIIEVDKTGETKIFQKGKPLLSEEGVSEIMTVVRPFVNRATILSNHRDDEIERIMKIIHVKLVLNLAGKKEMLGLSDPTNLHMIVEIVTNMVWSAYKRSEFALEQNFMSKIHHITESKITQEQPKGKFLGIFGKGD
jgi:hypothetical protein